MLSSRFSAQFACLLLMGLLALNTACVTETVGEKKFLAPQEPTVALSELGALKVDLKSYPKFKISGLTAAANRVFAVSSAERDSYIYEIAHSKDTYALKPRYRVSASGATKFTGVDFCNGNFFVVDQSNNSLHQFSVRSKQTAPISVDYRRFFASPTTWMPGSGYSGVALDCLKQMSFLLKERDPRMVVAFDLNKSEVFETFNFAETDAHTYTDTKYEGKSLYLLEGNFITKADPEGKRVIQKVSFSIPDGATAQALLLKKNEIWIGTSGDNQILKYSRPQGF